MPVRNDGKVQYECEKCFFITTHKTKYSRHLNTVKHKIALDGIKCCDLVYFNKHRWVNHKRSLRHQKKIKEAEEKVYNQDIIDGISDKELKKK